jgi:hypothetical protein
MIHVSNIQALEQFGVNPLTGEACAFAMRVLCDLNAEGAALLQEFLGIPAATFPESWNSRVNGQPAVASIMLTWECLPSLARFALWRRRDIAVIVGVKNGGIGMVGYTLEDWEKEATLFRSDPATWHTDMGFCVYFNPRIKNAPTIGTRHVHGISGRTE